MSLARAFSPRLGFYVDLAMRSWAVGPGWHGARLWRSTFPDTVILHHRECGEKQDVAFKGHGPRHIRLSPLCCHEGLFLDKGPISFISIRIFNGDSKLPHVGIHS